MMRTSCLHMRRCWKWSGQKKAVPLLSQPSRGPQSLTGHFIWSSNSLSASKKNHTYKERKNIINFAVLHFSASPIGARQSHIKFAWQLLQKSNFLLIKSHCSRIRRLFDWLVVDCHHAQKPENGPISDLFNLTQNTFCPYCLILT